MMACRHVGVCVWMFMLCPCCAHAVPMLCPCCAHAVPLLLPMLCPCWDDAYVTCDRCCTSCFRQGAQHLQRVFRGFYGRRRFLRLQCAREQEEAARRLREEQQRQQREAQERARQEQLRQQELKRKE